MTLYQLDYVRLKRGASQSAAVVLVRCLSGVDPFRRSLAVGGTGAVSGNTESM